MSNLQPNPEQKQAIETITKNVVVSAGAGSGKTRVLVERFLYILERQKFLKQPVDAANILAITFTRKAAGEMQERVRKGLEERLADDSSGFWRRQLAALNRAQISTIHGLCSRILRENPVEAQLDPSFTVAEEFEGDEFREKCLLEYLRQQLSQKNAGVAQLVAVYGVDSLMRQLQSILPSLNAIAAEDLTAPYAASIEALPQVQADLCIALRDLVLRREELTGKKSSARNILDALAEQIDVACDEVKQNESNILAKYLPRVQARGKIKDSINNIKDLQEKIKLQAADKNALSLLPLWQDLLRGLDIYLREQKLAQDLLTFDDLENFTVELLEKNAQVRHKYQERFRYIMVDEFQDTNDRQRQLIYLLCGDSSEKLAGSKLFIVGDPKQSIYRFRGADVSVFARVRREIAASSGVNLKLSTNYRSMDKILAAVNSAFRVLLGEDKNKDVYFEALAHNKICAEMPQLLLIAYDKECGANKFYIEAQAVAQAVKNCHEGKSAAENNLPAAQIPYGKMAILLRAMTHCGELAAALQEQGIPYEIVDGRGFYECQEVLDILNLLTALDNRCRSLELAGVLRSPYFGLNDETLTQLFLQDAACLWDALMQARPENFADEQAALVERAAKILQNLRSQAALVGLPELWQYLWQELAVEAVLVVQEHGANKLANVQKLRQLSQTYSVQHNGTLGAWLDYVRRLRAAESKETAANLDSGDAVQIMTIHKSKGLEFDTVFLPFLDSSPQSDKSEIKYLPQIGLGIKAPDANGVLQTTSILQKAKDADKVLEHEERKRQLYVAMTRAEQRLILTGITDGKESKADKALDELSWLKQLQQIYQQQNAAEIKSLEPAAEKIVAVTAENKKNIAEAQNLLAPLPSYNANGQQLFSPSALQTYLYCQRQYFYQQILKLPQLDELDDEEISAENNFAGQTPNAVLPAKILGSIVHRALELYRGDLTAALTAASKQYAPAYRGQAAKNMLEKYLASELYKNLPQKQLREMPFYLSVGDGLLLSGIIDLLAENPDGTLTIIDYKTGRPPQGDEEKLGYSYQLAVYKTAVEKRLQKKVTQAQLHFLQNLSVWNLPADKDYLQEALALCREISSKGAESEFACREQNAQSGLAACAYCPYNYLCNHR